MKAIFIIGTFASGKSTLIEPLALGATASGPFMLDCGRGVFILGSKIGADSLSGHPKPVVWENANRALQQLGARFLVIAGCYYSRLTEIDLLVARGISIEVIWLRPPWPEIRERVFKRTGGRAANFETYKREMLNCQSFCNRATRYGAKVRVFSSGGAQQYLSGLIA